MAWLTPHYTPPLTLNETLLQPLQSVSYIVLDTYRTYKYIQY